MRTYLSILLMMLAGFAQAQVTTFPSNVVVNSKVGIGTNPVAKLHVLGSIIAGELPNTLETDPSVGHAVQNGAAFGDINRIYGINNLAAGHGNYVDGFLTAAIGNSHIATANDSFVEGNRNSVGRRAYPVASQGVDDPGLGIGNRAFVIVAVSNGDISGFFPNALYDTNAAYVLATYGAGSVSSNGNIYASGYTPTNDLMWAIHPYAIIRDSVVETKIEQKRILKTTYSGSGTKIYYDSTTNYYSTISYIYSGHSPVVSVYGVTGGNGHHGEGVFTSTWGDAAHAEGYYANAWNAYSHAEGYQTEASGLASYASGYQTKATGTRSRSIGHNLVVSGADSIGIALSDQSGATVTAGNVMAILGGNVGINSTNPGAYKLDIITTSASAWSPASTVATERLYNNSSTANSFAGLELGVTYSDASYAAVKLGAVASGSFSSDFVLANRNGGTYKENFRITYDGKVGIGTTAPTNTLDVQGHASIRTNLYLPNLPTNGSPVAFLTVDGAGEVFETAVPAGGSGSLVTNANQFGASLTLSIKSGADLTNLNSWGTLSANGPIVVESANSISWGDGSVTVLGDSGADYISFGTGSAERIRVIANGNVGIGTLTPGSKLSVSNAVGGAGTPIFEAGTNNTGNGLLVSSNGNVAIGSRIPSAQLDVPGEGRFGTLIATNATFTNLNVTTVNANTLNLTNALGSNQVRLAITNLTDVSVPGRSAGDSLFWNPTMFKWTNGQPAAGAFSGNSNQIPFLNVAGTGFLFGSTDKSAPGFGFQRNANGGSGGALLIHADLNEDIGLVQIGLPTPGSSISAFVPSLSISNRYSGDGQTTQEMVRVNFVDIDGQSSAESFIQTWRSWVSGVPPASTLVAEAAKLRKDGKLSLGFGLSIQGGATLTNVLYAITNSLNFPSTAAGTVFDAAVSVPGAADGDIVSIGVPSGSIGPLADGSYSGFASNNVVYIRFSNNSLVTAMDPAAGTFKVRVDRFQ